MTKRAIYPFSPWLPIAIAAPTPISALVHSSTLVTAGLYLIMRFSSLLYSSYELIGILLVLRVFTSFYAGINTIFEIDLKKLIALSTLSHLGFIGLAYSAGLLHLAFFHILAHALFKSLLFITMGDIMINLNHSQDIRYLSSGFLYTPSSCSIMYVSLFNLLGFPILTGFYSKDYVLEAINYSYSSSAVFLIMFFNIFFTYYYTYQLFYYSFSSNKIVPYQLYHAPVVFHIFILCFLAISTLFFPFLLFNNIYYRVLLLPVPSSFKFFPIFLNLVIFLKQFTIKSKLVAHYFSRMIFLSPVIITMTSNLYYNSVTTIVKSFEQGLVNYSLNFFLSSIVFSSSKYFISLCYSSPLRLVLFSIPIVLLLRAFLLSNINKYM